MLTNLKTGAIPESEWAAGDTDWQSKGVLKKFQQYEFLQTYIWKTGGLAPYGYIYYPNNCYNGSKSFKVHMYLHGCTETIDGPWLTGDFTNLYYGGWLEYAAANDIILLMPQARFSTLNPYECFEVENRNNLLDQEFQSTNKGNKMNALKEMLQRVTEPRSDTYDYEARNILALDDFEFFLFDSWRYLIAFPNFNVSLCMDDDVQMDCQ